MATEPQTTIIPDASEVERVVAGQGLVLLGIVSTEALDDDYARFADWIAEARHGEMAWLEQYGEVRRDPGRLLAGARTAIVIALPYHDGDRHDGEGTPRVARYAGCDDYHKILRRKGERIARALHGGGGAFRVVADTAPLLERALAARSARGFIGKNTCYIHPERGSFLLLGEILSSLPLATDGRAAVDPTARTSDGGCGGCTLCQTHCPTGALATDYRIDATRCLAYWTIEHRGAIPEEYWPWLGKYWFGCDICQNVCPYNWKATGNTLPASVRRRELPALFDVATMSQAEYEAWFGGTPMTRAKRGGLQRNALIAMTVTGDGKLDEAMDRLSGVVESPVLETLAQIGRYRAR